VVHAWSGQEMSLVLGGKGSNGELQILSYDLVQYEHIGFAIPRNLIIF
jgi:hypothetical protein